MTVDAGSMTVDAGSVGVIIGSTRPDRICPGIADWFLRAVRPSSELRYELIDLAEVNLPFLDEPAMASTGVYVHEHTRRWSELVTSYDAIVFVFPQYNWAYPAVLKNAIDFLYAEWAGKPAGIVTYGTHGGGKGAAQLDSVLQGVHMNRAQAPVLLAIPSTAKNDPAWMSDIDGRLAEFAPDARRLDAELTELVRG